MVVIYKTVCSLSVLQWVSDLSKMYPQLRPTEAWIGQAGLENGWMFSKP